MKSNGLSKELARIVGEDGVLWRREDLMLYEYDALSSLRQPDVVVFPRKTEHVVQIAKLALRHNLPLVARGAGTGLSGGSVATEGGILLGFSRMKQILEIDLENQRARVQPGVVNLDLSLAVADEGYYYAPDPSSQKACTIGGNVAENSGGPHTLAYGVTTNHVLGAGSGAAGWRGDPHRREPLGPAGIRPDRGLCGFGGHARHRHGSHRAIVAQARGGKDAAGDLQPGCWMPPARWRPSRRAASRRPHWR